MRCWKPQASTTPMRRLVSFEQSACSIELPRDRRASNCAHVCVTMRFAPLVAAAFAIASCAIGADEPTPAVIVTDPTTTSEVARPTTTTELTRPTTTPDQPQAGDDQAGQRTASDSILDLVATSACPDALIGYLTRFDKINGIFVEFGPDSNLGFLPENHGGGPPPGSWPGINTSEREAVHFHRQANEECQELVDLSHLNLMHERQLDQVPKQRARCLEDRTPRSRALCGEGQRNP